MSSAPPSNPSNRGLARRLFEWLDRRAAVDQLLRVALAEPIPGGASVAYVFGSGLLFLFLSQLITGVFLALYYVPSADHAHVSVAYMVKVASAGAFLRSIHAYGSSAVIIVLLLHLTQVYTWGAYKGRRELAWLAGIVLLFLMATMAFTGYLLPWDQNSYFATTVGTNLISEIPWAGEGLKELLRGGTSMGTLTVSRFFVIHVFFVPALIFLFVTIHVYLFRKAGAAGPVSEDPLYPRKPPEMFYPRQLGLDMAFVFLILAVLGLLSVFHPYELGPAANPAHTQYLPRPEWYYRPMFQALKYFPGSLEVVGILVIPGIIIGLLIALPFIDRGSERRPWKRPIAMGLYGLILLGMVALGVISFWQDSHNPAIVRQLQNQRREVEAYMAAPFKPYMIGASQPAGRAAPLNPLVQKGETVFTGQGCNSCHGNAGAGTAMGPALAGVGSKFPPDKLASLIRNPPPNITAAGMPSFDLSDGQMKALVAYLDTLQ
jgi:quinol-cytochrome oxidoreductase complex cytochrome b subunit